MLRARTPFMRAEQRRTCFFRKTRPQKPRQNAGVFRKSRLDPAKTKEIEFSGLAGFCGKPPAARRLNLLESRRRGIVAPPRYPAQSEAREPPLRKFLLPAAFLFLAACAAPSQTPKETAPLSGAFTLDAAQSSLAFVTVKAGAIAEAHSFKSLSGSVGADGAAEVDIALDSVETNVDIRNERMRQYLFETQTYPDAKITATLDPAAYAGLKVGDRITQPLSAMLSLHGVETEIAAEVAVTRIAPDKVLVESVAPIILHADDFNLGAGVAKLQELANLSGITPSVPVTFSFVFTK